jgi:hypothetical protein
MMAILLTQCETGIVESEIPPPVSSARPAGFTQPLVAVPGVASVTIREGARVLSTCQTALPNVEDIRWHKEQEQIVVKSRANHGPATVQLFDCRTGAPLASVPAYLITADGPAWAARMGE